jgi:hypothetical protein
MELKVEREKFKIHAKSSSVRMPQTYLCALPLGHKKLMTDR